VTTTRHRREERRVEPDGHEEKAQAHRDEHDGQPDGRVRVGAENFDERHRGHRRRHESEPANDPVERSATGCGAAE
jgi:hypothetical protein